MTLLRVRIRLDPSQRQSVVRSLIGIVEPSRALPGCLGCQLCADMEDENVLVFAEEWADQDHLASRLRGDGLRVLLAALDCAVEPPELRFDTISRTQGIELIVQCREAKAPS